jgi:hypothetical protein
VGEHERRLLVPLDDLRDGVRLAGAGDPEKSLVAQAFGQAFAQSLDGFGLVAGGFEVGNEPEFGHFDLVSVSVEYTAS